MNKTKTLCHMAWDYPMFFMFTNSIGYCCRTPRLAVDSDLLESMGDDFWSNHPQFVKRREELVKGIKSKDCETCWKLEDAGFKSSRSDEKIEHFMKKNDPKFPLALQTKDYNLWPGIERSNYSNCIEIVLNNTCDAKCTYCSEFYSTQWLTEKKKYREVSRTYTSQEHRNPRTEEVFWSWYENRVLTTNRRFGFIGGEPLIIDAQYECFDKLLEIHSRNEHRLDLENKMELCITSNLNTPPTYFKRFLEYVPKLERYFKIIIQVSGENTEKDLEYVRHGVKWTRWSNNIEYLLQHTNIELAFLPCLNLLSIPRFDRYLEYFHKLSKQYGFMLIHQNIVTHPIEQSPMMAPREFAGYFDSCISIVEKIIQDYDLQPTENKDSSKRFSYVEFIEWLKTTKAAVEQNPSETEPNFNSVKFYRFFKKLDERRKTNVLEVFPEVEPFYRTGEVGASTVNDSRIIPIQKIQ